MIELHPEILSGMIIRNRKADVTDAQGNFIFKGKVTRAIEAEIGTSEREFEEALGRYFRLGYQASERRGRQRGALAVGFVMTTYRKLAASSSLAIHRALERRLRRLTGDEVPPLIAAQNTDEDPVIAFEQAEIPEGEDQAEFFDGEMAMLEALLDQSAELVRHDRKLEAFLNKLIAQLDPTEKVLIFTEYRSTQEQLAQALKGLAPGQVDLINGSQNQTQRQRAIEHFEDAGRFLVSTEAGGEGFNLQRRCHIMVNYDQPWNPMRLVQRVGRLYRYGQDHPVVVFNLRTQGNLDDLILANMYGKLEAVAQAMASVSDEYREGLQEDILGAIAGFLDVSEILEESRQVSLERTQERIDDALARARLAAGRQDDLLRFSAGFDARSMNQELPMDERHLPAFIEGMVRVTGGEVRSRMHAGQVWEINIGESVSRKLKTRQNFRVAFSRRSANLHRAELLDNGHPLLEYYLTAAQRYQFQGQVASLQLPVSALGCSELRWQDEGGKTMRESYRVFACIGGAWEVNSPLFSEWLLEPARDGDVNKSRHTSAEIHELADQLLSQESTEEAHPGQLRHVGFAHGPG